MFADDVILYRNISSTEDCDLLQSDINKLCEWQNIWQMQFNTSKCFIMHVTHKKKITPYKYHLWNSELGIVDNYPYLGVHLSNNLSWNNHINTTVNKANSILGLLKRNLWNCSTQTKDIAYKTLVRPRLEYCCSVWDPHQKRHQDILEKTQRRAARFVSNKYQRTSSVTDMLGKLKWDTLQDRRTNSRLIFLFKEIHNITPCNINQITSKASSRPTTRITRQSHDLNFNIIRANKDCYKYSLYPRTIVEWNSLSPSTKSAPDLAAFKKQLSINKVN